MKRHWTFLVTIEMQIKTIIRYHSTHTMMALIKKTVCIDRFICIEDMEKLNPHTLLFRMYHGRAALELMTYVHKRISTWVLRAALLI